jgi:hypothetical protein
MKRNQHNSSGFFFKEITRAALQLDVLGITFMFVALQELAAEHAERERVV